MNITNRITSATFSACITNKEELPKDDLPIIALVGRSNVGKSSLINSLTGRKELARTSSMPGKTLTMNFYCINDAFYLVDLPGYGYAKASKATRNKIQAMMDDFFTSCNNLKGVVQIIDIRHKPSTLDLQMHNWLKEQHFNGFAVLTKSDKLSNQQIVKMRSTISKDIRGVYIMCYSSKTVAGRDEFLDAIEKILGGFAFKVTDSRAKVKREDNDEPTSSLENEKVEKKAVENAIRPSMTGETPGHQKKEKSDNEGRENRERRDNRNNQNFNRENRQGQDRKKNFRHDNREGRESRDNNERNNGNRPKSGYRNRFNRKDNQSAPKGN